VKVLAIGDSFMPVSVFEAALAPLAAEHELTFHQIDAERALEPRTGSERAIREYEGHPEALIEVLDGHDALLVHGAPVTDAVLDAAPGLRVVGCARGGPVNVDVDAATERGIPVTITPGKNAEAVADLTVAYLVMLARGIPRAQRFLLDGGQLGESTFEGAQFLGHDLGGMTLGLVGFGQVGSRVAARAAAFGMRVLVHDPYVELGPEEGVQPVSTLEALLARSDFVSLHLRAGSGTENLFAAEAFAAMKPGAWFVNTARETLIDEAALLGALGDGQLSGAALDVVRPMPGGRRNPLLDDARVIVTPHIGGATHETLRRGAEMLAEDVARVAAGESPHRAMNLAALEARA
jgi:D-3-phosphoglycerate dehydrogenase